MTKSELLNVARPILFKTGAVSRILEGKKTQTRRVVPERITDKWYEWDEWQTNVAAGLAREGTYAKMETEKGFYEKRLPYQPGSYLYVRETWAKLNCDNCDTNDLQHPHYVYRVANGMHEKIEWKPSVHMPKEAARIFLRVKDVRVERLQDITEKDAMATGSIPMYFEATEDSDAVYDSARDNFVYDWDCAINYKHIDKYGWRANPWVFVIDFEKVVVDE